MTQFLVLVMEFILILIETNKIADNINKKDENKFLIQYI